MLKASDHHKDTHPRKTIKRIKKILNSVGFNDKKTTIIWNKSYDSFFSCGLIFNEYPTFRSNGKGLTKELALASAYAEFIERLQCMGENAFFAHGKIPSKQKDLLFDYKYVSKETLAKKYPFLTHKISDEAIALLPEKLLCLSYINPQDGSKHYLPYFHLLCITSSNGMCAGNTYEEALSQGICEIFERYILISLHENTIQSLPNIPLDKIEIKSPRLKKSIKQLKKSGIDLTIKDCTSGGIFPVVAIICEDKKKNKIGVNFGSDPIFEIALQRCLTEVFQGKKELATEKEIEKFRKLDLYDLPNNPSILYEKLIKSSDFDSTYINAFSSFEKTNKEHLDFLFNILKKLNLKVFVHDFSFLGFPSYQVYIEKLSSLYSKEINSNVVFKNKYDKFIDKILHKLADASDLEKEKLLELLGESFKLPHSSFFYNILVLCSFNHLSMKMNSRLIYLFLLIDSSRYLDAQKEIKEIIDFNNDKNPHEKDFLHLLLDYVNLRISNFDLDSILSTLNKKHKNSLYKDSFFHLMENNWSSFFHKEKKDTFYPKKFEYLPIPNCLGKFKCQMCGVNKYCYAKKNKDIQKKLISAFYKRKKSDSQNAKSCSAIETT